MSKTVFMTNVNYTFSYQYPMVRGGNKKPTSHYHWDVKYITFYILQLLHFGVLKREILERHFGNHSKISSSFVLPRIGDPKARFDLNYRKRKRSRRNLRNLFLMISNIRHFV